MALTRTLKLTLPKLMVGKDVEAHKRGVARALGSGRLTTLMSKAPIVRRTFGVFFVTDVKRLQELAGISQSGVIGPVTHDLIYDHMDDLAVRLLKEYAASVRPRLVEPNQGFNSLHSSLWEAYTIGRRMGLSDLGTYNPASRLPSGAPSDHAVNPAMAFDLGFSPGTGWNNITARAFAEKMAGRAETEYVILGDRIWSRDRGWRRYSYGGHEGHVHCSGIR
ncbi:hypothetical protein [Sporichthya sp.]|uniref:hypothetical protein n=1 Tax=Sporichthya sp. TaxID=65475 RepID=UPI0017C2CF13|nr:hypothetical protein [Sporichthya sp.]MBA3745242.1 hypothetical protein [Sporichthya sp.]